MELGFCNKECIKLSQRHGRAGDQGTCLAKHISLSGS